MDTLVEFAFINNSISNHHKRNITERPAFENMEKTSPDLKITRRSKIGYRINLAFTYFMALIEKIKDFKMLLC